MRLAFVVAALSLAIIATGSAGATAPTQGTCSFGLVVRSQWLFYPNAPVAEMPDGAIVVGATQQHDGKVSILLRRVNPNCQLDTSFGAGGTAAVETSGTINAELDAIYALPSGDLLVAGSGGGHDELVARLLPNGQLDPSFGTDGWTRFTPRVKWPGMDTARIATSIAVGPSGSIFLGGNDETAHCCTVDYVSELTSDGSLVQGFGKGGTVIVPKVAGSYISDVWANADGTVYAFTEYEQSGCGYPVVDRIRADGSLDGSFDSTMARTLRRLGPARLRFTPTPVPGQDDAFTLLGGFDETCAIPAQHEPSGGAVVNVTAAGRLAGERRFRSPNYAFDGPATLRLASGATIASAEHYDNDGRVESVIVRSFASDGAAVATSTIPRASFGGRVLLDGLVPGSAGGAWLVMSSRKSFELIPVH